MIDVYEYADFRDYLKDYLADAKKRSPAFSHRFLAQKLGLSTPNLILLVMQGKRNLTPTIRYRLSEVLKHTKKEAQYFEHLVSFSQAKTHDERNMHYASMLELKRNIKTAPLEKQQYEYYSNWYNPVIRELVIGPDFSGDLKSLAKKVSPPITREQARRSIELLLDLGLIKKKGKSYVQTDPLVSTGPVADSVAVANFHRKTALLAAESFDRHTRQERTITSCTITLSEEHFQMLKREIADLRKKALELAEEPLPPNRVYQMNMQLFPVSKNIKKAGSL
jgi:uncharacterized protein (TIGR02147 family)